MSSVHGEEIVCSSTPFPEPALRSRPVTGFGHHLRVRRSESALCSNSVSEKRKACGTNHSLDYGNCQAALAILGSLNKDLIFLGDRNDLLTSECNDTLGHSHLDFKVSSSLLQ